jgi:hypothetical protein
MGKRDRRSKEASPRSTRGEGVPKTKRDEARREEDSADPRRRREPRSGRLIERSRTARNPDGI